MSWHREDWKALGTKIASVAKRFVTYSFVERPIVGGFLLGLLVVAVGWLAFHGG